MGKRKFEFKRYDYHNVEDALNQGIFDLIFNDKYDFSTVKWYPSTITVTNVPTTLISNSINSVTDSQRYRYYDWRDLSSTSSFYYDFSAEPIAITTDSNTNNVSVSVWE